ncbi:MAG TPA: hypothetical protein VD816_02060, partial [Ohtaekwangia sp.]|nr:hypothetical protein [Ohtaekwangia sp.]
MEQSTRKRLCRILLSGIIVSFQLTAWAQVEVPKMPTVIPPSPSAASLGKYGSIPVSLHTGIPEIRIPLHTIVSGSLQLPISLNYHAAGFRVSELAPWAGLGWTLFAGGAISRSAVGLGDDSGIGFLDPFTTQHAADIGEEDLDFLLSVTRGTADNESDIYFYNFAGRSGKFVLNDDRQPVLIPREPLDITYSSSPKGFTIVTEDGTKYRFFTLETLTAGTYTPDGEESDTYTGTYYLTEIISADDTDHINFNYGSGTPYTINTTDYVEILGDRCDQSGLSTAQHDFGNTFNFRIISELYLESITFAKGSILFNRASDRTDFGPISRLTEIIVQHETLTDPAVIDKRFTFQTGYFPNGAARLKLNSITELDASGNSIKKHEFTYNETAALPGHGAVG